MIAEHAFEPTERVHLFWKYSFQTKIVNYQLKETLIFSKFEVLTNIETFKLSSNSNLASTITTIHNFAQIAQYT